MTITRMHVRFMATRLLLIETLRLLPDAEAIIWKASAEQRLTQLRNSTQPGSELIVESIEEYVAHLDFIRGELL